MKISIKSINEIRTPESGVLLFVDQEDSKLKGKKSNNEILNFSNSSMKYYKCTSVDTVNKTWSGYELVYNEAGYYELLDVITENLTYSRMTPVAGSIYNEDATLRIDRYSRNPDLIPEEGLVFHASLNGNTPTVAETGQVLTKVYLDENNYNFTYMIEDGIPCVSIADADGTNSRGYSGLTFDASALPTGSEPRTISLWVKIYNYANGGFFAYGAYSMGKAFYLNYSSDYKTIKFSCHGDDVYSVNSFDFSDRLHHLAVVLDGTTNHDITMYFDGVRQDMTVLNDRNINTASNTTAKIGCGTPNGYGRFDGWLCSIRVYDRVLGEDEIAALANEFTTTTA